jgi:hypothetical protein
LIVRPIRLSESGRRKSGRRAAALQITTIVCAGYR